MGTYYKITWNHVDPDLPTHILLAVDHDGNPVRRISVFADRHWEWTNDPESLPDNLTPDRDRGDEFRTDVIDSKTFVALWTERHARSVAVPDLPPTTDPLDEAATGGRCRRPGCGDPVHVENRKRFPVCRTDWTLVTLRCYQRPRYRTYRHAYNEAKQLAAKNADRRGHHLSAAPKPQICDMCRHWHVHRPGPGDEQAAEAARVWRDAITEREFNGLLLAWNPSHDPDYHEVYSHPIDSVWKDTDGTLYHLKGVARSARLHLVQIDGSRRVNYPKVKDFFNTFTPIDEGR